MSLPHFYLENQVVAAEETAVFPLRLAPDDAKHARVLRLAVGEHVAVVDAAQDYFECEIVSVGDEVPLVRIAQRLEVPHPGATVLLVQGLAKGDKMEAVIRHATELGVAGFLPLACERSIVKLDAKKAAAKTQRWQAIAKSAAMQSGQCEIPEVCAPSTLDQACTALSHATAILVCWEEAPGTARLSSALWSGIERCRVSAHEARIAVVVGPEGGLTEREVDAFLECNERASLVSLGPSILRTETAGIVASALALYELGGLGNVSRDSFERDVR
ncbi:RsmE family RNA methyltransferase [Gordonibacter sp.]|uniref:RsmE family RNA methyltransferase n=1 Tax=Gordonibacter sp. TaxID=1968902 RepID=UPI002FCC5F48